MASIQELPTAVTEAFMLLQIEAMSPFDTFNGDAGAHPMSTLNHKYSDPGNNRYDGDGQDASIPDGVINRSDPPRLRYFGVGTGGTWANDEGLFIRHPKPTDGDLQNPIPLKVISPDEEEALAVAGDLDDYRMRVVINELVCYFLKVIDWYPEGAAASGIELVTITPGSPSEGTDLNTVLEPTGNEEGGEVDQVIATLQGISKYTHSELIAGLGLMGTNDDADNANSPFKAPYETALMVNEMGFYTGSDITRSISDGAGGTFDITDAGYVQLALRKCFGGVDMNQEGRVEEGRAVLEAGRAALL